MMLKAELSQRAKAFSVECLLSAKNGDDRVSRRKPETENEEVGARFRIFGGITAELCCNDLWERFNRLRTEMIVTRAGRRMFPTLKIRLYGLQTTATYIVYMDVTLAEDIKYRYNFQRSEWTAAGPSNSHTSSFYVHPDSPAKGDAWMTQQISFDKVKLTNNSKPAMKDQVPVHSMHKYQPRIHVLEIPSHVTHLSAENLREFIRENGEKSKTFTFEQTAFISVTAYQNQKITKLKIQSNPFARGFRHPSSSRKGQ